LKMSRVYLVSRVVYLLTLYIGTSMYLLIPYIGTSTTLLLDPHFFKGLPSFWTLIFNSLHSFVNGPLRVGAAARPRFRDFNML